MADPWPPAERPDATTVAARRTVVEAAAAGDVAAVVAAMIHRSDRVRATAVKALASLNALEQSWAANAAVDPSPRVRRAVAEVAPGCEVDLDALLDDPDPGVVEVACWAAGERSERATALVPHLATIATGHADALCREAAVAALGAIGAPEGLRAILTATEDKATVRRRAVLALAPFDGPDVDAALERALGDRDWQVRQAAEDLLPPTN